MLGSTYTGSLGGVVYDSASWGTRGRLQMGLCGLSSLPDFYLILLNIMIICSVETNTIFLTQLQNTPKHCKVCSINFEPPGEFP